MAEKKTVGEAILGENKEKIGSYLEAPGGGTPLPAGQKAPSKEWVAANRKLQPRDSDGKFTYNAANRKPLEYGPSRGTTIPPFLRGISLTYAVKSDSVIMDETGKRYLAGINMTAQDIINAYKEYVGKGFKGLQGIVERKKGAKSKVEKLFQQSGSKGVVGGITVEKLKASMAEYKQKYAGKKQTFAKKIDSAKGSEKKPFTEEKSDTVDEFIVGDVTDEEKSMAKENPVALFAKSENAKAVKKLSDSLGLTMNGKDFAAGIANGDFTWKDVISTLKEMNG